jgi:hypothetical protein
MVIGQISWVQSSIIGIIWWLLAALMTATYWILAIRCHLSKKPPATP